MKKYFILGAAALAMAACSNDESENIVDNRFDNNVINLSAQVAGPSTRAGYDIQSTAFATGEAINVECTPVGGTLDSKIYTTDEASEGVNALTIASNPFYWPSNGANVTLKAYYPSYVTSETTTFTVSTDQSGAGTDASTESLDPAAESYADAEAARGYKGSDLMYSDELTGTNVGSSSTTQGFTFTHALTKIIVKLAPGAGMDATAIAACTVTLHAKKTATIAAGVVSAATGDVANITMGTGSDATNGIAAIIVPQTIDGSSTPQGFITVTSGGNSATYQLSAETTFAAGTVYTYKLAVGLDGITLQSTSINNWTGTDEVDATANPLTI